MKNNSKQRFFISSLFAFCLFITTGALRAQELKYTDGNNSWNPSLLGNHRAVVQFTGNGTVAKTTINWRRRDENPDQKQIIVQDAKTGKDILNVKPENINRESGTIFFEPVSGKGTYYVYYLPYIDEGPNVYYPKGVLC